MIACGIFFMAIFAILALVSGTLRNARSLRGASSWMPAWSPPRSAKPTNSTKAPSPATSAISLPGLSWETDTAEVATNGLFQVDIVVRRRGFSKPVDAMSIWVFAPDSPSQGFGRPTFR